MNISSLRVVTLNTPPLKLSTSTEYNDFLKEISHPDSAAFAGHLIENVVDEVALEGLDGITLQALKVRLQERPNLEIEDFEDIGPSVWNQMKVLKYLSFYYLPSPRRDLISYRWDQVKDERGNPYEPLYAPEEIYPYFPVEDKQNGLRGSCEHYKVRKDVGHIVRRISYHDAIRIFGNQLVIVADQAIRERALFGENYKKQQSLSIVQYCIMERVGRARHAGETTRGKVSLQCLNIQPKTLFYNRKTLLKSGIVIRQSASMKFANCKCPAAITVFHLPRFYRRIEPPASLNIRQIFSSLNNSPTKSVPVEKIISRYGKHTLRNVQNQFGVLVEGAYEVETLPPPPENENDDDIFAVSDKKRKPRTLRVLRLKVTDINIQNQVIKKVLEGESVDEDKDSADAGDDDKEEKVNVNTPNSFSDVKALRPEHAYLNVTDSCRLYKTLIRAGTSGVKQMDLIFLKVTNLEARSAIRFLNRHNLCKEGVLKMQKSKAFTFTLTRFAGIDIKYHLINEFDAVMEQIKKLRKLLYEQKIGRRLPALSSVKVELSVLETPDLFSSQSSQEHLESPPPVSSKKDTKKKKSKDPISTSKKSPAKGKSKKSGSNSLAPINNEEFIAPAEPTAQEIFENRASILSRAIENMPTPSLCLVKPVFSIKSELVEEERNETDAEEERSQVEDVETISAPSIVINAKSTVQPMAPVLAPPPETHSESMLMASDEDDGGGDASDNDLESNISSKIDAVDLDIRRRMTRQRVDWNPIDDRFVLLAFVASILFIQKYNFSRVFIFNSPQIRDLMLKKYNGLSNKTSLAIRRRVHFLMNQKDKGFYETWIAYLYAAMRDNRLYEDILKHHIRSPRQKLYNDVPFDALERVYDYLVQKFEKEEVPSVVDVRWNLNAMETLLFLRQLKRAQFYWNAMMFVIFCPMGYSVQSRRKFREFWRNYLNNATLENPDGEVIIAQVPSVTEGSDPLSDKTGNAAVMMEEDDTNADMELLEEEEKDDDVKTPEELYSEFVFKFLRFLAKALKITFGNILMLGSTSKKKFQLVSFDVGGLSFNICNSSRECNSTSDIRLWTARCVVLDLVLSGDPTKSIEKPVLKTIKLPVERAAKSLTHAKILICRKKSGCIGVSRHNLRPFVSGLPKNAYDETLDFLEYIDEASNVDSLACISCGILMGIVDVSDYFKPIISLGGPLFTVNAEYISVFHEIAKENSRKRKADQMEDERGGGQPGQSNKRSRQEELTEEEFEEIIECFEEEIERDMVSKRPSQDSENSKTDGDGARVEMEDGETYICSSTDALRLLRSKLNQAGVVTEQHLKGFVERDFFTINLPNLEFVFPKRNALNLKIVGTTDPFSQACLKELRATLVELVYHSIPDDVANEEDLRKMKFTDIEQRLNRYQMLLSIISCAGSLGVSGAFLATKFEKKSLVKGLRYLLDAKLIFSVGVTHRRFVSYNNVYPWIIPIRKHSFHSKVGHVIMRPWITPLGGLSWSTINRLFISLLGQLQRPEVSFDELCEIFSPTLSKVEVMVLIEALEKLKYVTIYRLIEPEVTMFSKHRGDNSDIEYHADTLVDTKDVFVVVSPYTTFLQAQLQNAIQAANRPKNSDEVIRSSKEGKFTKGKRKQQ